MPPLSFCVQSDAPLIHPYSVQKLSWDTERVVENVPNVLSSPDHTGVSVQFKREHRL